MRPDAPFLAHAAALGLKPAALRDLENAQREAEAVQLLDVLVLPGLRKTRHLRFF